MDKAFALVCAMSMTTTPDSQKDVPVPKDYSNMDWMRDLILTPLY